jgi:hypothetical protein
MWCQLGPVVTLRRHARRTVCGRGARLIRSLVQTGLEEAAWKRPEHAVRGPLIATQREKGPFATAQPLTARELKLAQTLSAITARREPEHVLSLTAKKLKLAQTLNAITARREPEHVLSLTARKLKLAQTLSAATARREPEHVPSLTVRGLKLARKLRAGSVRREPENVPRKLWQPAPEPPLALIWR